jgi:hypothetical protein
MVRGLQRPASMSLRAAHPLTSLLLLGASLALAGCASQPSGDGDAEPAPESIGEAAQAITSADVVARAQQWLDVQMPYCQAPNNGYDSACGYTCNRSAAASSAEWDPYRSDCSGFVSWAWGLPAPGRVTWQLAPYDNAVSHEIDATELQPGDALNINTNAHQHVMLFMGWVNGTSQVKVWQESNCNEVAHESTFNVASLNGPVVDVGWSTFHAIRYDSIEFTPPNAAPTGYLDNAGCDTVSGWSQDPDDPTATIAVHVYFDGPAGAGHGVPTTAAVDRADLCAPLGSCNHGFALGSPFSLFDGNPHEVHAYGIDSAGGPNPELASSPGTLSCPPTIPAGVARWVTNPTSYGAWKLDGYFDQLPADKAIVDAIPRDADLPDAPVLARVDGDPSVYLVDGNVKHHVPSPEVMTAWRFSFNDVQIKTQAEIDALLDGAPVRARPTLVVDSEGRVLLIDDALPKPPAPGSGSGSGSSGAGGSESAGAGGGLGEPATTASGSGGGANHDGESGTPGACALGAGSPGTPDGRPIALLGAGLLLVATQRRKR